MRIDDNGIAIVENTDPVTPLHTLLNTMQAPTSQVIGSIDERIEELNSSVLLDRKSLEGNQGTGTALNIPVALRGQFRRYSLHIFAGSLSVQANNGIRPLVIRVNGDSSESYRASCTAFSSRGFHAGTENNPTAFPRTGYISLFEGAMSVDFYPRATGNTNYISWHSSGWANRGSSTGNFTFIGGGRWNNTSRTITHFTVRTNVLNVEWRPGSYAELWGMR